MTGQHEGRMAFYGAQYTRFGSGLAAELRREVFGEDIGQEGWRTAAEQVKIADFLGVGSDSHVLDVACGSGGPSLALIEQSGCLLTGVDVEAAGISYAQAQASERGIADRATFAVLDCNGPLPFGDGSFDAVLCIDAISHFRDRFRTLSEWARLLRQGGRLVFTDSLVITGAVTKSEIDIRTADGFFVFVPPGLDEEAINGAGLVLLHREDRTAVVAEIAERWRAARARHAAALEQGEGVEGFSQRQRLRAGRSSSGSRMRLRKRASSQSRT